MKEEVIVLSSDDEDTQKDESLNYVDCKPQNMDQGHVNVKEENLEDEVSNTNFVTNCKPSISHLEFNHPNFVVETTALDSVSHPEFCFQLSLPKAALDNGMFSSLQIKFITYSCQRHDQKLRDGSRAGYLIGNGAGFGKGRIASGIILNNYLQGRKKAVWLSVSSDLQYDAERDLIDTSNKQIAIFNLKKVKRSTHSAGVNNSVKKGVVYSTYSTLTEEFRFDGETSTRLEQLLEWCGDNFDGVIVFDECHQTSRLVNSGRNILQAVLELQKKLPNARVVYMSATGISDPRNMAFMSRLGLWGMGTSFKEFKHFVQTVKKGGVGSTEMVAMEMKQRGMYSARQLSFVNVKFKMMKVSSSYSFKFVKVYDNSVKLWVTLKQSFAEAEKLTNPDPDTRQRMWDYFWLAHFNFFKHLCISAKVMDAVKIATASLKSGKSVVIGVQSTGESHTLEKMKSEGGQLSSFVSTGKSILLSLVDKHFPVLACPTSKSTGRKRKSVPPVSREIKRKRVQPTNLVISDSENEYPVFDYSSDVGVEDSEDSDSDETEKDETENRIERVSSMKICLLTQIEKFGAMLPQKNVIDQLIDELGGPEKVAEISSRQGRIVQKDDGQIQYESRSDEHIPLELSNIREKELFMSGNKNIAIVSEIASNGISLHADRRVENQRNRVYISLELPCNVDIALQQFGCTCRSNQVSAPEYFLLYSDLAGEERFASIVAKRLKSLGAVNLDNHRSLETVYSKEFNLETEYGQTALNSTAQAIIHHTIPSKTIPPPSDYQGQFFSDVKKALVEVGLISTDGDVFKEKTSVSEFLKRILGVPVELQKRLYKYLTDTMAFIITQAKKQSEFDGIDVLDWGIGQNVRHTKIHTFSTQYPAGPHSFVQTEIHRFEFTDQGMSWKMVQEKLCSLTGEDEGFYVSKETGNGHFSVSLVIQNNEVGGDGVSYSIIRPNTGMHERLQLSQNYWAAFKTKSVRVTPNSPQWNCIQGIWNHHYIASKTDCFHTYWFGRCTNKINGLDCQLGLRQKTLYVLRGPILSAWKEISSINHESMQVVRVQFQDIAIVGLVIPKNCVITIVDLLVKHYGNAGNQSNL